MFRQTQLFETWTHTNYQKSQLSSCKKCRDITLKCQRKRVLLNSLSIRDNVFFNNVIIMGESSISKKLTDLKFMCKQCNLYGQLFVIDAPYAKVKELISFIFLFILGIGVTGLIFLGGYEVFPKFYKIYSLLIAVVLVISIFLMTLLSLVIANNLRSRKQTLLCTRCDSTGPFE